MPVAPKDVPHPVRLAWEKAAREMGKDSSQPFPPPPYHVHGVTLLYLRCAFDPDIVRTLLPPELEPDDNATGTIAIYTVAAGMAIAPYQAGYFGLSVKGHDSPDGDVGCLKLGDFRTGVWGEIYRSRYLEGSRPGWAGIRRDGDTMIGEAGPPGGTGLRITARRTGLIGDETSGVNVFLGRRPDGPGFNRWTVASSGCWQDIADVSVEILDGAPEALRRLVPQAIVWPVMVEDFSMTFSPPQPLDAPPAERAANLAQTGVVDLFSRLGRPALIVAQGARLLRANEPALALSGTDLTFDTGKLRANGSAAQAELEAAIAGVLATGRAAEPIALRRRGGMPLLVQAMPLTPDAASEPAVLLLLVDPERAQQGDISRTLQLLGLTAAEARLAALVGTGKSPRESAQSLSITEGTARTTLKTVFGKLAVSRQSELAQLVARINVVQ